MRNITKALISFLAIFTIIGCSQEEFKEKFSYSPEKPKPGDEIEIKYNPEGTDLAGSEGIDFIAYLYSNDLDDAVGVTMERKGIGWIGEINTEETTRGLIVKFKSENEIDNNENQGFIIRLYEDDDNLVPGALGGLATAYSSWGYYVDMEMDRELAFTTFEEEFKAHPEIKSKYIDNYLSVVSRIKQAESNEIIANELAMLEAKDNLIEEELVCLANWYGKIHENTKADEYISILKEKYPKCDYLQLQKYIAFRNEADINKKLEILKQYEEDFPDGEYTENMYDLACNYYRDNKLYEDVKAFFEKYPKKPSLYRFYSVVSKILGEDANAGLALEIAKLGVDRGAIEVDNPQGERPKYLTEKEWRQEREFYYALNLQSLGNTRLKLGNAEEALDPLSKAITMIEKANKGEEAAELYEIYSNALVENKLYEKAMSEIESYIEKGNATSLMKDLLKNAFIKVKGSEEGFDEYLAKFESAAKQQLTEELKKNMIEIPAPQFSLTGLDGSKVSLADLKGKTVIIDFWATWCPPCKASFPGMKLAVDKYANDESVKFLFIDSWERVENKKEIVEEFIQANNYPFHVLMDEDNKVITDFKVSGIPTKFILDKSGNIRFKSIGFEGNTDKLVEEISVMIALINEL